VNNTALGDSALFDNTTGNSNIAIGIGAGANVTVGSSNIHIGNVGVESDTATIRIGDQGVQTSTFIAGISGQTSASGVAVLVNAAGQLGTTTSSRRAKDEIRDMGVASDGVLKLRPVAFQHKPQHDDGARLAQYGLIAEAVSRDLPRTGGARQGRPAFGRALSRPARHATHEGAVLCCLASAAKARANREGFRRIDCDLPATSPAGPGRASTAGSVDPDGRGSSVTPSRRG
jgi:Chaperone of endosialidase